ncbi:hypothetical protein CPB84DRAFT_730756 [Gymnopilus junonius]|uniref:Uncharacterized protein n=1 Tax=Gymnopilus junonius TaxID=109634 RepID=A0A9P5N7K7_GYMJU|nr:hypothetical protein CPB84DRAFT_730756 [Gymnopilus junonius]
MLGHIINPRTRACTTSRTLNLRGECRYPILRRSLARQQSTLPPSDTSPIPIHIPTNSNTRRRLLTYLGIGFTSAFVVNLFSSNTIHGDAKRNDVPIPENEIGKVGAFNPYKFDNAIETDGDTHIESNPSPGILRRDSFQLGSNFPIEDVIATSERDFSPTLSWSVSPSLTGTMAPSGRLPCTSPLSCRPRRHLGRLL